LTCRPKLRQLLSIAVVGSPAEKLIAVRRAVEMDKYNTKTITRSVGFELVVRLWASMKETTTGQFSWPSLGKFGGGSAL